ncbi:MAG: DUF3261 domain-containing protein [Myxococcales bacterium]|nr:DUF3261 domain-containing protein [Myxococcales bacterium]
MTRWKAFSIAVAVLASVGCGGAQGASTAGDHGKGELPPYPGTLRDLSEVSGDFSYRQRVTFRRGETTDSMEAVLQKTGSELVLLALTPMGTRAFLVRQRGAAIADVQSFVPVPPPVPPEFVLLDVNRVHFMGAGKPSGPDAVSRITRDGEHIVDEWEGGALRRRTFSRVDGDPKGTIVIEFGETETRLRNGWLGYELTITRLD